MPMCPNCNNEPCTCPYPTEDQAPSRRYKARRLHQIMLDDIERERIADDRRTEHQFR